MSRLTFGKAEVKKVAALLEQDYESAEEAATAVLDYAFDLVEDRTKFAVVGQLVRVGADRVPASSEEAIKICLGFFSTMGDARTAAEQLVYQQQTNEHYLTWILNVFHGSPHEFSGTRKQKYVDLEAKQVEAQRERMKKSIEKYAAEAEARAKGALDQ